jgi:hypothetical protein
LLIGKVVDPIWEALLDYVNLDGIRF